MTLGAACVIGGAVLATVVTGGAAAPAVAAGAAAAAAGPAVAVGGAAAGVGAGAAAAGGVAAGVGAGAAAGGAAGAVGGLGLGAAAQAGLAGAGVAGPVGAFLFCFSEEMQVLHRDNSHAERFVRVVDLKVGDEVLSTPDIKKSVTSRCYHKVTNATVIEGNFAAHEIQLANGETIVATSPHHMIVFDETDAPFVVAAADVKVGDKMQCADSTFTTVERINNVSLKKKVNIEVESGIMFVNQVLTSGVCEFGPPGKRTDAVYFFRKYQATHSSDDEEMSSDYFDFIE